MSQMIRISDVEMRGFLNRLSVRSFQKNDIVSKVGTIPDEVFFIVSGMIRVMITDTDGAEHTVHFAMENQFISDYSNFMRKQPSFYTLQALENTDVVVLPRAAIDWGYEHLAEGQKMGRLIAEYYFIYQDERIKNTYSRTPKQRYDRIDEVFPNIHQRVPQHMIASYLGITPVHLSRLKKASHV